MTLKEGDIINERYKLIRKLGQGSFGNVWLAHNIIGDIDVAIKFYGAFDDKGIEEFRNEFKMAYKLHHPNLLTINQLDVYENCPYLVMPYCSNGSVNSRIGKLSESEIWKFVLDVSCGLSFLHSQQPHIIHQDIKPDNILISDEGRYVISDFGISRSFRSQLSRTRNNMNSSGTIPYMGPERFSEKPLIVLASDVWALGMTVYELLTGDVLWEGMGGCAQLNGARIPTISNIAPELAQLISACLSLDTWNRPTAAQVHEYAQAYLQKKPLPALKNHVPQTPTQPMKKQVVANDNHYKRQDVHSQSMISNQEQNIPQNNFVSENKDSKKIWFKRIASIAAFCLFGLVIAFGIVRYINSLIEERDFSSCQTKEDFERFIMNYPSSDHYEAARKQIEIMTPQKKEKAVETEIKPGEIKNEERTRVNNQPINNTQTNIKTTSKHKSIDIIEMTPNDLPSVTNHSTADDDQFFYNCKTVNDFRDYLDRYPNGKHRSAALQAIKNNVSMQNGIVNGGGPSSTRRRSNGVPNSGSTNSSSSTTSINVGVDVGRLFGGGHKHGNQEGNNRTKNHSR